MIIVVVLAAGVAIGWLLASQRAHVRSRTGDVLRDAIGAEAADALEAVQAQLVSLERGRAGSDATLQEQLRTMAETSKQLRTRNRAAGDRAARAADPRPLGRAATRARRRGGGYVRARRLRDAGVDRRRGPLLRPDLVVRLTGGKQIVVDSKVAFSAYLEAMEARDERTQSERLRAHARQLRQHVDQLAGKEYWRRFTPSPEFVVCFVPADVFLDAALREDPDLLEHAFARDVVLATPSTLIAVLRTIGYTWRQEALAENAAAIHELGRELYRRISTMGAHVDKLGRSLSASVSAYNDAVGSLERRVVTTARRMSELGVVAPGHAADRARTAARRGAATAQFGRARRAAADPAASGRARSCVT